MHDLVDLLLVQVVVLVEVDCDITNLALLALQQGEHAFLGVVKNLLHLGIDESFALLAHIALLLANVAGIFAEHTE